MAWTTSAVSDGSCAVRRRTLLVVLLLIAQLAVVLSLFHRSESLSGFVADEHNTTAASHASASAGINDSILIALGTGTTLVAILLSGWPLHSGAPVTVHAEAPECLPTKRTSPPDDEGHATLIARLHHDLRTPLNAMLGFADLMHAEAFGPLGHDRYRTYAAHMRSCGNQLLQATESTLAMAEILANPQFGTPVSVDLPLMVEKAWAAATSSLLPAPPSVQLAIAPGTKVRADAMALRQSFINLFNMAIAKSGDGGQIELSAWSVGGRIQVQIMALSPNPLARVASTGCRPCDNSWAPIEEMPLSVSRKLLEMQGIPLQLTADTPHSWAVTLTLENAAQRDLFEDPAFTNTRWSGRAVHGDFKGPSFSGERIS